MVLNALIVPFNEKGNVDVVVQNYRGISVEYSRDRMRMVEIIFVGQVGNQAGVFGRG